jgi:hypothetical protein
MAICNAIGYAHFVSLYSGYPIDTQPQGHHEGFSKSGHKLCLRFHGCVAVTTYHGATSLPFIAFPVIRHVIKQALAVTPHVSNDTNGTVAYLSKAQLS